VILVTDGAPTNLYDAHAHGFATANDYAQARRRELANALAIAGADPQQLVQLRVPDQQAALRLESIVDRLTALFARRAISTVLTHAYEGGHPDHDATAFAVHAAAALLARRGLTLAVVEMPFYHLGRSGMIVQRFTDEAASPEL